MRMRPVTENDIEQLYELAQLTQYGLTTLPKDRSIMEKRVLQSQRSFENLKDADPQGQLYLFVLIDPQSDRVVGTSGIVSKVGGFKPFYAYRLEHETQTSKTLDCEVTHRVLHLVKEHDGPSEIGSLFLHPDFRGGGNGRLLSLGRFLFMANFPELFEEEVIAEMRGVIDENGSSPFWEAIGSRFFPLDLPNADMLSLINKDFIEELMPKHPVYLDLLSQEAQASVSDVHPKTIPARRLLEKEGFKFEGLVDIFEAGPVLHCQCENIRAVQQSRVRRIESVSESLPDGSFFIVAKTTDTFQVGTSRVKDDGQSCSIEQTVAQTLDLKIGEEIRIVEIKPT